MRSSFLFTLLLFCLIFLPACDGSLRPSFFAPGYTYHNTKFNAPDGAPAESIGYEYSATENEARLDEWRTHVNALVDDLERELDLEPQKVHIKPLPHMNAFNASYDHIVREVFTDRGYRLTEGTYGLIVQYEAFRDPEDMRKRRVYGFEERLNSDFDHAFREPYHPEYIQDFELVLSAFDGDEALGYVTSNVEIPAYGYAYDEGQQAPQHRIYYKQDERLYDEKEWMHAPSRNDS